MARVDLKLRGTDGQVGIRGASIDQDHQPEVAYPRLLSPVPCLPSSLNFGCMMQVCQLGLRSRTGDEYSSNSGEHPTSIGCHRLTQNRPPSMHTIVTVGRTWIRPWRPGTPQCRRLRRPSAMYSSMEQAKIHKRISCS
jgi:hypothetical protein